MRRLLLRLVPAVVLVLSACGSSDDDAGSSPAPSSTLSSTPGDGAGSDPAAGAISQADDDLQVEVDLGDGSAAETWTLTCVEFVEGSHPSAQAACDHLDGMQDPFAPLPADVVCSQQYGGPQTAHVIGRWAGTQVDLRLSRVDGCRISQWDSLVPLVPAAAG
jgi:hypothetical protein